MYYLLSFITFLAVVSSSTTTKCLNPEVTSKSLTVQETSDPLETTYSLDFSVKCRTGLIENLHAYLDERLIPCTLTGPNKFKVIWTADKDDKIEDKTIEFFDEESFEKLYKSLRTGEEIDTIEPLLKVELNSLESNENWLRKKMFTIAVSLIIGYYAIFSKIKSQVIFDSYWIMVILRIALVFVPQTGYIHPDEFFQSVEVFSGRFLNFEHTTPWEFNASFPVRSMSVPYFTIGFSLKILKDFNYFATEFFDTTLITPYWILVFPRLAMCLKSFIVDFCFYKICVNNNEDYRSRLFILSSSYVMIVYATRTFSNTLELIFFSLLLYFVCESLTFSNILNRKRDYINYRYENSKTLVEKAKFHKLKLYLTSDSFRNCAFISTIVVVGFFTRPTFLLFALFPVFFWLYRGLSSKSVTNMNFYSRTLFFAICTVPTFLILILIDSFYYGYITWGEIGMLDVTINSFVFTPLNFIRYNSDPANLAQHGLHPKFLHVLVNVPLLFGILGIIAHVSTLQYLYKCYELKFHLLPTVRSIKGMMVLAALGPLFFLSIFAHQEPRFILPIIIPLVYLYGNIILKEPRNVLVQVPKSSLTQKVTKTYKNKETVCLLSLWLIFNAVLTLFYGFVHQGGVFPAANYLADELKNSPSTTEFHIVTSHIYSIPQAFLMQPSTKSIQRSGKTKFVHSRRVFLYEQGSSKLEDALDKVEEVLKITQFKKEVRIYFLISSSLDEKLNNLLANRTLDLKSEKFIFPHVSTEAFPDLTHYCLELTSFFSKHCRVLSVSDYLSTLYSKLGLTIYELSIDRVDRLRLT